MRWVIWIQTFLILLKLSHLSGFFLCTEPRNKIEIKGNKEKLIIIIIATQPFTINSPLSKCKSPSSITVKLTQVAIQCNKKDRNINSKKCFIQNNYKKGRAFGAETPPSLGTSGQTTIVCCPMKSIVWQAAHLYHGYGLLLVVDCASLWG